MDVQYVPVSRWRFHAKVTYITCILYVCLGYLALLLKSTDEKGTALSINCPPLGFCCVHVNEVSPTLMSCMVFKKSIAEALNYPTNNDRGSKRENTDNLSPSKTETFHKPQRSLYSHIHSSPLSLFTLYRNSWGLGLVANSNPDLCITYLAMDIHCL